MKIYLKASKIISVVLLYKWSDKLMIENENYKTKSNSIW